MNLQFFSKKWVKISLHVLVWVLLFSLPSLLRPSQTQNTEANAEPLNINFLYQYLLNCFSWIGLFYANSYILIPFFINRRRYLRYFLSLIPVIIFLLVLNWASFKLLIPPHAGGFKGFIFFFTFACIFFLACSIAFI